MELWTSEMSTHFKPIPKEYEPDLELLRARRRELLTWKFPKDNLNLLLPLAAIGGLLLGAGLFEIAYRYLP